MSEYVLTAIDTAQIQSYVFGSNRLKENIGGSELVELATHQWVYAALPPQNNVADAETGELNDRLTIHSLEAEVLYAGGGNTVILFSTLELAREFTGRLTRRVLKEAPGLELVVAHRCFDWEREALAEVVGQTLGGDLARKKQNRNASMPLLGLSVTRPCSSTRMVASQIVEGRPVSQEIYAKVDGRLQGQARLEAITSRVKQGKWRIPPDFDDLGRFKGDEGDIAVVHADGNGMGKRVEAIAARHRTPAQNRDYIDAIRNFSRRLGAAATTALRKVVDLMADALRADADLADRHRRNFPLRPIVFGGDDVTFVCHGRYGLSLAVCYLEAFEEATQTDPAFDHKPAHACAGVAVVKAHYPFARAYRLSEQLCHSAKEMLAQQNIEGSALDWHVAMSGITGSLGEIRAREYTVQSGCLHMRPVLLRRSASVPWRTWPVFKAILDAFVDEQGAWSGRRNKVKALREALRGGKDAVVDFLHTFQLEALPKADSANEMGYEKIGWVGNCCVYFDAIEMIDLFVDLPQIAAIGDVEAEHAAL